MVTDALLPRRRLIGLLVKGMLIPCLVALVSAVQFGLVSAPANGFILPIATSSSTPTETPTRTPTPTPTPSPTHTATPTVIPPTATPISSLPATPVPKSPPAWDGVRRSATVPILMYHYISAPPSPKDRIRVGLSVPPENFDAQMRLLSDNGFHTVSLLDVYNFLAVGQALPANPMVITFDDGYVDNYQYAFPILKQYGMIGTFFVLTGPPDANNSSYMTWDMLKEMSDSGMDIQLHSRDHVDLRRRTYDYLFFQIIGGRQSIEGHTGKPVNFTAYPSGKYDDALLHFLTGNDFWAALTTQSGRTHTLSDALTWTRVRIPGQMSLGEFAKLFSIKLPTP